jgi:hypothetical protein
MVELIAASVAGEDFLFSEAIVDCDDELCVNASAPSQGV